MTVHADASIKRFSALLTRRRMLAWLVGALAASGCRARALIDKGSSTTERQGKATVYANAQPGRLSFTIKEPIPLDEPIMLLERAAATRLQTEDPHQLSQAATRLLEDSGGFVAPRYIKVRLDSRRGRGVVHSNFTFLGKKDPDRRVKYTILFYGAHNEVIETFIEECPDARLEADESDMGGLSRPAPFYYGVMPVNSGVLERAERIDLIFEESE